MLSNGVNVLEQFKTFPERSIFFELTPEEVTLVFYALGIAVSQSLTINELSVLANGLFELAQVMFVIAAQRELINSVIEAQQTKEEKKPVETWEEKMQELQERMECMQRQINELHK